MAAGRALRQRRIGDGEAAAAEGERERERGRGGRRAAGEERAGER